MKKKGAHGPRGVRPKTNFAGGSERASPPHAPPTGPRRRVLVAWATKSASVPRGTAYGRDQRTEDDVEFRNPGGILAVQDKVDGRGLRTWILSVSQRAEPCHLRLAAEYDLGGESLVYE